MRILSLLSVDYKEAFPKLAIKRLASHGFRSICKNGRVETPVEDDELYGFSRAVADIITRDIRADEIERILSTLPFYGLSKRAILPLALSISGEHDFSEYAAHELEEYLRNESSAVIEGFLRFRLPLIMDDWAMAADEAGRRLAVARDSEELIDFCGALYELGVIDRRKGLCLILYNDGSCVLTDEGGCRIECASCEPEILLPLLTFLAPNRLSVYDLTGGKSRGLLYGIRNMFGANACFFVKTSD